MTSSRERGVDRSTRMTDHEALMWNVEKDPWLNPNGASLTLLDKPVDFDRFRNQIKYGITKMPRLYQRVVPGLGRFTPPTWAPDPEFDFDYHVRQVQLPAPGSMRQLLDLATSLYQEPLDRTRPLWRFVAISGVEGGRGAIYALTHHVIADGIGQLRMAELYQQISLDQPDPEPVDIDAFLASVLANHGTGEVDDGLSTLVDAGRATAGHVLRRQAGIGRRLVGELMLWPADTGRAAEKLGDAVAAVQSAAGLLSTDRSRDGKPSGSPLWRTRSRHRHLEYVRVPLDQLKEASKSLGGSVNDGFMAGLTEAAVRYHEQRGATVDTFNTSFVASTRTDDTMGGNSFTPIPVQLSGGPATLPRRVRELQRATTEARERSDRTGGISGLSGVINLLPTSVVTQTARKQAAAIDFATSNLRGAPFPLYCSGAKVHGTICMGPLAGTAINATALSYDGWFDIGLFIDPTAIDDPDAYRRCVEEAFADLLALAPSPAEQAATNGADPSPKAATTKATAKKAAAKKATAKKSTAKKATATTSAAKRTARTSTKKATAKKRTAGTKNAAPRKAAARTASNRNGTAGTPRAGAR